MNNFIADEFTCKCGCSQNNMDFDFLHRLDLAADYSEACAGHNIPYVINSGCRCPAHNQAEGSSSKNHVEGKAADIKYCNNTELMWIITGLILAGFRRIGINRKYKFIHADSMKKVVSCWGY